MPTNVLAWLGSLVLGLLLLTCSSVLAAVAGAGATVGPPKAGQR